MCTVSFVPFNNGSYILTHNRDERIARLTALHPELKLIQNQKILSPIDQDQKGTWITLDQWGNSFCLLNGGADFNYPVEHPKMSRGLMLYDIYNHENFHDWLNNFDFNNMAAFTMLHVNVAQKEFHELRWNGKDKSYQILPFAPRIYSSSTLYDQSTRNLRENWFQEIYHPNINETELWQFHQYGGEGSEEKKLKMNYKNSKQTVSITQIVHLNRNPSMKHINFADDTTSLNQF